MGSAVGESQEAAGRGKAAALLFRGCSVSFAVLPAASRRLVSPRLILGPSEEPCGLQVGLEGLEGRQ